MPTAHARLTTAAILCLGALGLPASRAAADDYWVRLEKVVTEGKGDKAKEVVVFSFDIVARPDAPFGVQAVVGNKTCTITGTLKKRDKGGFLVTVSCSESTVNKDASGKVTGTASSAGVGTTVGVEVGERVVIGGKEVAPAKSGKAPQTFPRAEPQLDEGYVLTLRKAERESK